MIDFAESIIALTFPGVFGLIAFIALVGWAVLMFWSLVR